MNEWTDGGPPDDPSAQDDELPAPPEVDPLIGQRVAGRYLIEKRLGEGGIGRVYRAIQEPLGRPVAVKLLHPELGDRKDLMMRFEREARASSKLAHHGSVMVFDFGTWNNMLYLVMELIAGRALDEVIRSESPLPVARIVDLGAQLCDALEAAHAIGLLHRDLKPENVLIARAFDGREVVKVCDYGLAYLIGDDSQNSPRLTRDGTVAGTPAFMAPEQVMSRPLDQRSDLYALGCVLYEMVCGRPPFEGSGSMEILTKQLYDEPDPPSRKALAPIPRELEQVILWALKKAPANRPQRAAEMKTALLAVVGAAPRTERPSSEEIQIMFDREARADAAGIIAARATPHLPTRPTREALFMSSEVLVVAPQEVEFDRSALAILRAQGAEVHSAADLEDVGAARAIVLDVRGDTAGGLKLLADAMARRPELHKLALIVIGPDDDFAAMTRALELQASEFIPESLLPSLPRKLQRALERVRALERGRQKP